MMLKRKSFLGLAVGDRSVVIAQVFLRGKTSDVRRLVEWKFPEDVSEGEPLGRALQQFLKAEKICPGPAVVGIPASWVLVKSKENVSSGEEKLIDFLKTESGKDFALSSAELVPDYVESPFREDNIRHITLLAAGKNRIESIKRMVRGAGLKVAGITPSILSAAGHAGDTDFAGLFLSRETVEFVIYSGGIPVLVKHVGRIPSDRVSPDSAGEWIAAVSGGLKRILMFLPGRESVAVPQEIFLWDDCGLTGPELEALRESLPLKVKFADTSGVAVSLARAAGHPQSLTVNFLHTRMTVQKKFRWRLTVEKGAVAAAAILIAVAAGIVDIHRKELAADKLRRQIKTMSPELTQAGEAIGYVTAANERQARKFLFPECLREITLVFPPEGGIWATGLSIREDMRGLLSGKASDTRAVLEVMDKLKKNPAFSDVNLVYIRQAGGSSDDIVYAINFVFGGNAGDRTLNRETGK